MYCTVNLGVSVSCMSAGLALFPAVADVGSRACAACHRRSIKDTPQRPWRSPAVWLGPGSFRESLTKAGFTAGDASYRIERGAEGLSFSFQKERRLSAASSITSSDRAQLVEVTRPQSRAFCFRLRSHITRLHPDGICHRDLKSFRRSVFFGPLSRPVYDATRAERSGRKVRPTDTRARHFSKAGSVASDVTGRGSSHKECAGTATS